MIGALSNLYDTSGDFGDPDMRKAYVALVHAMRHDSEAEDYGAFGAHVDNILITGPQRRQDRIKNDPALFEQYGPHHEPPPPQARGA